MGDPGSQDQLPPEDASAPQAAPRRKPYQPPRILSREPLEAMAATCTGAGAKAIATKGQCSKIRS